ncbi:DNA repair protein RadC [Castellaniella denitrificans]|uniref:DNA repair protein RadC n=1 Tax=Castellaniella denitrificans TaxID=56119 RepID=A0ABT4LZM1_9BURK|nr:DNA repair protein RadC [Castellaniella denitrificans]MCZ4328510.1 DNA repair protein RadC [Castellaniella denitrificans]
MNDGKTLFVRDSQGCYQVATDAQILAAGRVAAHGLLSDGQALGQPRAVKEFFQAKLTGLGHECAAMLFLDTQLRVIKYVELAHGTLSHASVYPREIVKTALRMNAAACIMSHNHPSGIPEPSGADISMTKQLKQALALIDVRLLDHIVVGATDTVSLAERGQC